MRWGAVGIAATMIACAGGCACHGARTGGGSVDAVALLVDPIRDDKARVTMHLLVGATRAPSHVPCGRLWFELRSAVESPGQQWSLDRFDMRGAQVWTALGPGYEVVLDLPSGAVGAARLVGGYDPGSGVMVWSSAASLVEASAP